jgi:tetratricopeptide (TPR) repeat protein
MSTLPLTKIGFFNPGRLSDKEIELSFIARLALFDFLFKSITAEKLNSIPQHHLIIGQRGMGKTSLLVRIAAELRKPAYRESFIPLSFPEEQYNIDRLSKFWLNCLDALADALDKENNSKELPALDDEISRLSKQRDIDANNIYETFSKWLQVLKRRPVLLIDNLNLIFSKLNKTEQHQLRAILISNGAPILIGTSPGAIEETIDYGAPFYDAFKINYLKKLSFKESLDVLINFARITGTPDLENKILDRTGRLEALYQLTGGTPRTLAILFPLIRDSFSESIQTDLDALLDIITPLYKAKFEELSAQLQVVLDAVALNWDPINLKQLRIITQLSNAQLSPQLNRLVDVGWLQKLDAYKAKGGAYEVSERFFNVWYIMRRSSRRQKRELYCLTKFLESFYGNDVHEIAKARVNSTAAGNIHTVTIDLALAEAVKEPEIREALQIKSYNTLFDLGMENKDLIKNFAIPEKVTKNKILELFNEAQVRFYKKEYHQTETILKKIISIDDTQSIAWHNLGFLYEILKKHEEAEVAYKKATEENERSALSWYRLGNLYSRDEIQKYSEAEAAFKNSIVLDPNFEPSWARLGDLYTALEKYEEAESAYKTALKLSAKDVRTLVGLGYIYRAKGKFEQAKKYYKEAANVDSNYVDAWIALGDLYYLDLGDYSKAQAAYKKVIKLEPNFGEVWNNLGGIYQLKKKYIEALYAYKKSIALIPDLIAGWSNLAKLYHRNLNRYIEAEATYKKTIELSSESIDDWIGLAELYTTLGNHEAAESTLNKALEINETSVDLWMALGDIYKTYFKTYTGAEAAYKKAVSLNERFVPALHKLAYMYQTHSRKYIESEQIYLRAIQIDENVPAIWANLAHLYMAQFRKYQEAEDAYKKAISIDEGLIAAWQGLGQLYAVCLGRYQEAEKMYKKALQLDNRKSAIWNSLGSLYQDNSKNYLGAESAYLKAIELDSSLIEVLAKYNLVFLWRDKMNKLNQAKELFATIEISEGFEDSHHLNEAIFALYEKNLGTATSFFKMALGKIRDTLPLDTQEDWYRAAAVIIKLNFGNSFLQLLTETGHNITLRPFYVAIEALVNASEPNFLNSISVEVREPAKKIMDILENHLKD